VAVEEDDDDSSSTSSSSSSSSSDSNGDSDGIRLDAGALSARASPTPSEDDPLGSTVWRFGHEAATRHLRNSLILRHVEGVTPPGLRDTHLRVLRAMLALRVAEESDFGPPQSLAMSAKDILRAVNAGKGAPPGGAAAGGGSGSASGGAAAGSAAGSGAMSAEILRATLNTLATGPVPVVGAPDSYGAATDRTYFIQYRMVLTAIRLRTIEHIVTVRSGGGARVATKPLDACASTFCILTHRAPSLAPNPPKPAPASAGAVPAGVGARGAPAAGARHAGREARGGQRHADGARGAHGAVQAGERGAAHAAGAAAPARPHAAVHLLSLPGGEKPGVGCWCGVHAAATMPFAAFIACDTAAGSASTPPPPQPAPTRRRTSIASWCA
jgi:hypothetical protein